MKLLYLVNHDTYLRKMSRERFHGVEALKKYCTRFHMTGNGWDDYDRTISVAKNIAKLGIDFDAVIVYKPLELIGFKELSIPVKCIRYNEMYDVVNTINEIAASGVNLVVCHHLNDYEKYQSMELSKTVKFTYIGHCAHHEIFTQTSNGPYDIDVSLIGNISSHYPLRIKFVDVLQILQKKYGRRCYLHRHPGYDVNDAYTNKYLKQMVSIVNRSRIVLTDSGLPRSRFGKYVEVPMCNRAVLCGDVPDDDADDYNSFIITVDKSMSNEAIAKTINDALDNTELMDSKRKAGLEMARNYTQDHYAMRIYNAIGHYFMNRRSDSP